MRVRMTTIVYIDRLYMPGTYVQVDNDLAYRLISLQAVEVELPE